MSIEDKKKVELERWIKHREQAYTHSFYSSQRFDLLIISISGAGIYIVFETMRFIKENCFDYSLFCLIGAGIVFTLAIMLNFGSQLTAQKANSDEVEWTDLTIDDIMGENSDQSKIDNLDLSSTKYDKATSWLNYFSAGFMASGVILLLIFYVFIF